jgi:hypothetical protein
LAIAVIAANCSLFEIEKKSRDWKKELDGLLYENIVEHE